MCWSVGEIIMIMLSFRAGKKSVLLLSWFTKNEGRSSLYNKELSCLCLIDSIFCLGREKISFSRQKCDNKFFQHGLKTWNSRKPVPDPLVTTKLIPKGTLGLLYNNIAQLMTHTTVVYVAAFLAVTLPSLLAYCRA